MRLARLRGALLQGAAMHIASPLASLVDNTPVRMATHLLDEIAWGMKPVWPTTERYADRLVEGLRALRETRGVEVVRAIVNAPDDAAIEWRRRLRPLTT
jgi:hypothetical protein